MRVTTIESIPGKNIVEIKGTVIGSTIKTKHIGKDIMAGLSSIVGKDLKSYNEMMNEAREEAMDRMKAQAESIGANAVVGVRISPGSAIMGGAAEVFVYGTAVVVE